ncbi:MAG: ribosome biogenesis GTPase Der [Cytophagales bacterium]|nr:ribosome biogenesis GTPase Der [Cytophagales bacterium]
MGNIVAIVGRPNVGKSTFFNRLIGERKAIMDNESGITRDRHYGHAEWTGKFFSVIDTGGYVLNSDDVFEEAIRDQVSLAIDEANVILFMVDSRAGMTDLDKEFASVLRRTKKPIIVVANKADNTLDALSYHEFYALGFESIHAISSQNGSGTGDLLDEVVGHFQDEGVEDPYEGIPKIAILGRPNAGKSSFLNVIMGKERSIVTDQAGTTRDSINSYYNQFGKEFVFVDTAGVRKKKNVTNDVEFYSVMRAINSLESSDVCILMVDATRGVESQDINLFRLAHKNRKGIVILINKWDLVEKDGKTLQNMEKEIHQKLAPHNHVPILFISVLNKQRIYQALDKVVEVYENRSAKIATSELNALMLKEIEKYSPPAYKGKYIKIKYVTQLPTATPTIAFFCNLPQYIKEPYERYLENKLRYHFGFEGVPINIVFRKK